MFLDAESEQYHIKSQYTTTLEGGATLTIQLLYCDCCIGVGLLDLEATLPLSVTELSTRPPSQHTKPVNSKARQEAKMGKMLDQVYSDLKKDKTTSECLLTCSLAYLFTLLAALRTPRLLQRVEKPIPRPPTPSIEPPDEVQVNSYLQCIVSGLYTGYRGAGKSCYSTAESD